MSQTMFHDALLDPNLPVPQGLLDAKGQPAGKRFSVYRNNVTVSLKEALETGFPATAALLGASNFDQIAKAYLRSQPPASPLMIYFGAGFAEHIAAIPALSKLGYLPDVARLEYALRLAYHAADAPVLPPETLAKLSPEALESCRLCFAPAVQLIRSDWPILAIRDKVLGGTDEIPKQPQHVLITRPDLDPVPVALSPLQAEMIATLQTGAPLAQAMATLPDADLGQVLAILLSHSALTDITEETAI